MGESLKEAQAHLLKNNKKFMILGQGVNSESYGLKKFSPKRVLEMPISEVAFSGMAVGLASQGFRPLVHHIRTEFSLLVLDQILTHASRWQFNFKKNYHCPVSFRIGVGRGWGNGPQHTATYHSIFLQSPGLNVLIPAFAQDSYDHVMFLMNTIHPSVILEHRWLYKFGSVLNKNLKITKLNRATLVMGSKKILLLTYGDGLVEALKTKEILNQKKLDCSIMNISYFPAFERFNANLTNEIKKYQHIYMVDTSPYEFGLLQGLAGELLIKNCHKKIKSIKVISPPFVPCPTSAELSKVYYPNSKKIINIIFKDLKLNKIDIPEPTFNEIHLNPDYFMNKKYKIKKIY